MNTSQSISGGGFNTTHWSVVMLAGQENSPQAASALEKLCRDYWYPLYAYARRQGQSAADAQDSTQQFFAVFLEKKYFGLANRDRGRFRSFLLGSFKHFLTNEFHRASAVKRGGKCAFLSWDETEAETHYANEPARELTPDKLFDRAWALTLLQKVMENLRDEYVNSQKKQIFEALEFSLTGHKSELTYQEIGGPLGMGESAVKMAVSRLKQRYGEMLRKEIAHTVAAPGEVDQELRHLFSAVS